VSESTPDREGAYDRRRRHLPCPPDRYLPYLTTTEVAGLPKEQAAVAVVVAAIEQHGPHLPIVTDLVLGESFLRLALEEIDASAQIWVLPSIAYGKSNEHRRFAGTITLSQETLAALLKDVARSVASAGFRRLVFVNSHGGNPPVLDYVSRDIREETGLMVFPVSVWRLGLEFAQVNDQEARWGTHAGEWETSLMLALAPELVRADRVAQVGGYPTLDDGIKHVRLFGPVTFAWVTEELSVAGTIGDPRPATFERGRAAVEATVARLADVLAEISRFEMPIPAGGEQS
jgi:creatinine amidohydrolase/Fe(II)-dependent formamide hydrolase-like protein